MLGRFPIARPRRASMLSQWRLASDTYLLADSARAGPTALKTLADRLLSDLLGVPGQGITISREPGGKPTPSPMPGWLSRAHRHGLTLLGARRDVPVGVDLELADDGLPHQDVAETFFDPAEAAWLASQPAVMQPAQFCALWTIKEAVLKCTGEGIINGLARPAIDRAARHALVSMGSAVAVQAGAHWVRVFKRQVGTRTVMAAIATPLTAARPGNRGALC